MKTNVSFDSDDDEDAVFASCPHDTVVAALEQWNIAREVVNEFRDFYDGIQRGFVYPEVTNTLSDICTFNLAHAHWVMQPYIHILETPLGGNGNESDYPDFTKRNVPALRASLIEHAHAGVHAVISTPALRSAITDGTESPHLLYQVVPHPEGDGISPNQKYVVGLDVKPLVLAFFADIAKHDTNDIDYRLYHPVWIAICDVIQHGARESLIVGVYHRLSQARADEVVAKRRYDEANVAARKFRRLMAMKPERVHVAASVHGNFEPFVVDADERIALTNAYHFFNNDNNWSLFDTTLTRDGCPSDDSAIYTHEPLLKVLSEYAPTGVAYTMRSLRIMRNIGWHAYVDERLARYRRRAIQKNVSNVDEYTDRRQQQQWPYTEKAKRARYSSVPVTGGC